MNVSRENVDLWKKRFFRKHTAAGVVDVTALRALSDNVAAEAGELVTIIGTTMEGGGGTGQVTGNKMEMLMAVEELLENHDPEAATAEQPIRSRLISPDFSCATP